MDRLPDEIMADIMLQLPYTSLVDVCQTDKRLQRICKDNIFWMNKLDYDFMRMSSDMKPLIPSIYVKMFPNTDGSWRKTYERWKQWEWDKDEPYISNFEKYYDCALFSLMWESSSNLQWFMDDILEQCIKFGHIQVLDTLTSIRANTRYASSLKFAIQYQQIDILNWLETKGIYADTQSIYLAIKYASLNVLDWLEAKGLAPSEYTLNKTELNIPSLEWLIKHNIYPSQKDIIRYIREFAIDMLNWANKDGRYMGLSKIDIIDITSITRSIMFNTRMDNTIYTIILKEAIDYPILKDIIDMIQWAIKHEVQLKQFSMSNVLKYDAIHIMSWLLDQGIYPTQKDIMLAIENNSLQILKLLATKHLLPDQENINLAARLNQLSILNWLEQIGLFPQLATA